MPAGPAPMIAVRTSCAQALPAPGEGRRRAELPPDTGRRHLEDRDQTPAVAAQAGDDDAEGGDHAPPPRRTGTATEQAPRLISSTVVRVAVGGAPVELPPRSRPGWVTVCGVIRAQRRRSRVSSHVVRGGGQQHLADPGGVQRQPAAHAADDRHRLAAPDTRSTYRAESVAHGQVHGVAGGGCTSCRNGAATWRSPACTGASSPRSHSLRPIS